MKLNKKYNYVRGVQAMEHGSRIYDFNGMRMPSVTTILSKTKDQSFLTAWKNKVGHENAERIKNHSASRGTAMHKFLESGWEIGGEAGMGAKSGDTGAGAGVQGSVGQLAGMDVYEFTDAGICVSCKGACQHSSGPRSAAPTRLIEPR